jgi:hypothetical protein
MHRLRTDSKKDLSRRSEASRLSPRETIELSDLRTAFWRQRLNVLVEIHEDYTSFEDYLEAFFEDEGIYSSDVQKAFIKEITQSLPEVLQDLAASLKELR